MTKYTHSGESIMFVKVTSDLLVHSLQIIDRRSLSETWSWRSIRGYLVSLYRIWCWNLLLFKDLIPFRSGNNLNQNYWSRWSSMHFSEISIGTHLLDRRLDSPLCHSQYSCKCHLLLLTWQYQMLSHWQAAFVPSSESALDTSYFTSRYSWNPSDNQVLASEEDSSDDGSMSGSSSCLSNRQDELVPWCFFTKATQNIQNEMMSVFLIYRW